MFTRTVVVAAGERLPVEEVEERVVEMYVRDVKQEFETVFVPFLKMCKTSSAKVGSFLFSVQIYKSREVPGSNCKFPELL